MKMDNFSLISIIEKIKSDEILLPDFQRSFVWKQDERQISLICSVLSKMPIGSILLLEGDSNEFAVRKIGMKETYTVDSYPRVIDYLLDGQQRTTVLACAFSDVIYEVEEKSKQTILSPSLKRRFFLTFPKYEQLTDDAIYFGAKKLSFPYEADKFDSYPEFIAGDIKERIEFRNYARTGKTADKPFNPYYKSKTKGLESKELIDWCTKSGNLFYIPLYLITKDKTTLGKIISEIAKDYKETICSLFSANETDDLKDDFAKEFLDDRNYTEYSAAIETGAERNEEFEEKINSLAEEWANNLKTYLISCLNNLYQIMSIIEVKKSQRERAIDIYENLNKGGVSLSIFDLVIARASLHEDNKDFKDKILSIINKPLLKDDEIKKYNYVDTRSNTKAAYIKETYLKNCKCIEKEDFLNSKYIDVFLNIMSLYANAVMTTESSNTVPFGALFIDLTKITMENAKRKAKLDLDKDQIYDCFELSCNGIDRALYFLKNRCGVKAINDIPYNHVLSIISFLFMNDEFFNDNKIHELIEAWYWAIMFSGEFDKDQNSQFIAHLHRLLEGLNDYRNSSIVNWISSIQERVFENVGFSDMDKLLIKDGEPPKGSVKNAILQYYLSCYYPNFSARDKDSSYSVTISAYTDDVYNSDENKKKYKLQVHHIIPLNSMAEYKDNKMRTDTKFYGNSPLNLLYIVAEDNNSISDDDVSLYLKKIDTSVKTQLNLYVGEDEEENNQIKEALKYDDAKKRSKENVMKLLEIRYCLLKRAVKREITSLLKFDPLN